MWSAWIFYELKPSLRSAYGVRGFCMDWRLSLRSAYGVHNFFRKHESFRSAFGVHEFWFVSPWSAFGVHTFQQKKMWECVGVRWRILECVWSAHCYALQTHFSTARVYFSCDVKSILFIPEAIVLLLTLTTMYILLSAKQKDRKETCL